MSTFTCPHCQRVTSLSQVVQRNLESYGGQCLSKTACCGMGINVSPVITFNISPYYGMKTEDDWGQVFTGVQPSTKELFS